MYRSTFVFLILVAACAYGSVTLSSRVPQLDGRIVGGENATIEQFPYQVSVRRYNTHICGGSIYNSRVIVTAAHCIYADWDHSSYSIQYGTTIVGGGWYNDIGAQRIVKNENYDSSKITNDVALIFLLFDIPLGANAQPIALASSEPAAGTSAVVSGWGNLREVGFTCKILQKVTIKIVDRLKCQQQYARYNEITPEMLCAGVENGGKDACQGDSGGPLAVNGKLVGIVSWGIGCARPEFSGVYSNVAHLKSWIEANSVISEQI